MFDTENTECYLKSIQLDTDGEKRVAKLRLFVTPLTYDLAQEVDPTLSRALFKANGVGYKPVLELHKADFAITRDKLGMAYRRHPEYKPHHVLIPHVDCTNISAQKLVAGDPNFSLLFTVGFEILDKSVITDLVDLLKSKIYVTFSAMQPELFGDPVFELKCRMGAAADPEYATSDNKFAYCEKHRDQKESGETLKRIRETKKASDGPKEEKPPEEKPDEPIAAKDDHTVDGSFINRKAARRQRGEATT